MWWCLNAIRRLNSLPATTSDVPMKLSRTVVNFGFFSLRVFEANRQRSVATPSTTAPVSGDTYKDEEVWSRWRCVNWKWFKIDYELAGQLNSQRMLCLHVFPPVQATKRIERIARHNNRPWAVPMSLKPHLSVSLDLRPCLPCACTDMQMNHPILVTTRWSEGTGKWHKWRHQSYQQLKIKKFIKISFKVDVLHMITDDEFKACRAEFGGCDCL